MQCMYANAHADISLQPSPQQAMHAIALTHNGSLQGMSIVCSASKQLDVCKIGLVTLLCGAEVEFLIGRVAMPYDLPDEALIFITLASQQTDDFIHV